MTAITDYSKWDHIDVSSPVYRSNDLLVVCPRVEDPVWQRNTHAV